MALFDFEDIGEIKYSEAKEYQQQIFNNKIEFKQKSEVAEDKIIFCTHPHVYTIGKSGDEGNMLQSPDFLQNINAEYVKTDRGGDITYHGPGQIVVYPILDLDNFDIGVKQYVNSIEEIIIQVLKDYKIESNRNKNAPGVWLDIGTQKERKICALGIKVSRGVTMHGLALNVNTDLSYYEHINPCGFSSKAVTSVQKELGKQIDEEEVKNKIKENFVKVFNNTK